MRTPKIRASVCSLAIISSLIGIGSSNSDASDNSSPLPQFIYSTRKGLDVQKNKIDRLINTFGFICDRNAYTRQQCRVEKELMNFLKELPPVKTQISRELSQLGATCNHVDSQVSCRHERHVEGTYGIAGSTTPRAVIDHYFQIDFLAAGQDNSLEYDVRFNRKSHRKIWNPPQ